MHLSTKQHTNLEEFDVVFVAESLDQSTVASLVAVLGEKTQESLTPEGGGNDTFWSHSK